MLEGTPHLREDAIARLLHGDLSGPERQAAEAHLADCPTCRHELAEVRAIQDDRRYGVWSNPVMLGLLIAIDLLETSDG